MKPHCNWAGYKDRGVRPGYNADGEDIRKTSNGLASKPEEDDSHNEDRQGRPQGPAQGLVRADIDKGLEAIFLLCKEVSILANTVEEHDRIVDGKTDDREDSCSKIKMFASTAMPRVRRVPARPGIVSV